MNRIPAVLIALVSTALCTCSPTAHKAESYADGSQEHTHTAPHGGHLIALGDHVANIEVVVDAETGTLDLYVLDAHAEGYIRLSAPTVLVHLKWEGLAQPATTTLSAMANPLTGETVGNTSRYSATLAELKGKTEVDVNIPVIEIGGTVYTDVAAHLHP